MKHRINIYYNAGKAFTFEGDDIGDITLSACARLLGVNRRNTVIYINSRYFCKDLTTDVGLIRKDMITFMESLEKTEASNHINFDIEHLFEV